MPSRTLDAALAGRRRMALRENNARTAVKTTTRRGGSMAGGNRAKCCIHRNAMKTAKGKTYGTLGCITACGVSSMLKEAHAQVKAPCYLSQASGGVLGYAAFPCRRARCVWPRRAPF